MISLITLELLSATALIFSILLVYLEFAPLQVMAQLFVWTVAVGLLYCYSRKWGKASRLSLLLLLAPAFLYRDSYALAFIGITAFLLLVYLQRHLQRGSQDDYVINLKRMLAVYPIAFFIRWTGPDVGQAINRAAPFIFVYFLSSIMLIRSVRHVEAGMDTRRLQGTNAGFLGFLAGFLLFMSVEKVQQLMLFAVRQVISLLFFPIKMLLWLLAWQLEKLGSWFTGSPLEPLELPERPKLPNPEEMYELDFPEGAEQSPIVTAILSILRVAFWALLIGCIIFILYKLLARVGQRSYRGLDYVEEREYLQAGEWRRKRKPRFQDQLPSQPGEQVRYYYRRFLERLVAQKTALTKADTTLEIQEKAEAIFPQGPKQIRDIYIASRYGDKEVDGTVASQMERLYKGLGQKE